MTKCTRLRNWGCSFTRRSASRAVFQQLEVPKKITVASPVRPGSSDKLCPRIGKLGLESSSNDRFGASLRSDAARAREILTAVICADNEHPRTSASDTVFRQ